MDGCTSIVLKGKNFCSRCGESIIKNTKIDGLIADDLNDYISKAIHLSKDIKILLKLEKIYINLFYHLHYLIQKHSQKF